jgi:hypothetical protein
MRRNYISPEFTYNGQYGTMNMIEETSFFGSKMLYIQNYISVDNQNIVYYQNSNNEQVNFSIEKNSSPIVYSSFSDKQKNHTIIIDPTQSSAQKNYNTKWLVTIDIKTILSNFLFATLKQSRTFNGITNNMTIYNNINASINEYISKNILNRYEFSSIDFYVQYQSFVQNGTLRYNNSFIELNDSTYLIKQLQSTLSQSGDSITINFNQSQDSASYNFNYYFNLYFKRI